MGNFKKGQLLNKLVAKMKKIKHLNFSSLIIKLKFTNIVLVPKARKFHWM